MAEITQTLGFDASAAIDALNKLDQSLQNMEQRLRSAVSAIQAFNQQGKLAPKIFGTITRSAGKAAEAVMNYGAAAELAAKTAAPVAPAGITALLSTLTQAQSSLQGMVSAANQAQAAMTKLGQSSTRSLKQATKQGDKLMVTFGTLSRVIATQLVVRAMSALRNALGESLNAAMGFQTQLAQIQTIGGPAVGTLEDVATQVRAVSEAFNKPIEDVAQGYYNILSNQIDKAADAHLVLVESARLATVAVASLDDATNALSSIINSYGMNASDAADISGKLFAAVDKGRFTLSEIANSIGRSTTLAHEMGVSLEEVLASLATLTINGLKVDEAQTLLTNSMRGLLKPTKAMKAAFAELGVANAEVGVATYGFQGFLERLRNTTNGTASEIAQMTENIRVGRGVFGLTGEAAEKYQKVLEEIRGAGAESLQGKFQLIMETNAQQVQKELTELRNFFVNDFGIPMLKYIKETVDAFGGLVNIVKSLKTVLLSLAILIPAITALKAAGTAIMAATKATTALTLGLRALIGLRAGLTALWALVVAHPIIAVAVAVGALTAAVAWWTRGNTEAIKTSGELTEQLKAQHEAFVENANQEAAAETIKAKKVQASRTKTVQEAFAQQFRLIAELKQLYEEDKANAVQAQEDILDRLKDQLKERVSLISKVIHELEQRQQESARVIEKNRKETSDLKLQGEERHLDRQLGRLKDHAKAIKQLQRARELEGRATKAANEHEFESAEDLLKTADERANDALKLGEARLKEAKTTSEQRESLLAIGNAEREVNAILQQRLSLREQENKMALAQAKAAEEEIATRREQLKDAKRLIEQIGKFEVISKDSQVNYDDRADARKEILSLTQELEKVLSRGDVNLEEFLGIQDLARKIRAPFESALTDRPVSLTFAFDEGIDAIFSKLEGRTIKLKAYITEIEQSSGAKFSLKTGTDDMAVALVKKRDELFDAINDLASEPQQRANLLIAADQVKTLSQELGGIDKNIGPKIASILTQAEAATFQALQGQGDRLQALSSELMEHSKALQDKAMRTADSTLRKSLFESATKLGQLGNAMADVVTGQQEVARLQAAAPKVEAAIQENVQAGMSAQNAQFFVRMQLMQKDTIKGQEILITKTDLLAPRAEAMADRVSSAYNTLYDDINRNTRAQDKLNESVAKMPTPMVGGVQAKGKSLGGLMSRMKFFESGGAARGTDTIPAMLSPGEFIISAKNARRFLPQLQAINAGVEPVYRETGGTTTVNVGDINITESKRPGQTGREVMKAFRRELRRGSGRL